MPFYDLANDYDDKYVSALADYDSLQEYVPGETDHIVDQLSELTWSDLSHRWDHLILASKGVRLFSNDTEKYKDSPIYAGPVPSEDKARKAIVDAFNAETRARHFSQFGVNYIGRTKLSPRNIFVLDNKKGNPFHDPALDPTLEALYASLPDDWWGSCGFVSTSNVNRLETFLEDFQGDVIPLAYTTGAFGKLKHLGLDYVDTGIPQNSPDYGVRVRDMANRLSYKLSQPENPTPVPESGFKYNI
jgi:hypothetical protein